MRNTWAVYLVNERTGKIEWTLGGKQSSFKIPAADRFQWQHDAQLLNPTTLTVFDDHCCDITGAGVYLNATGPSRGLVLKLERPTTRSSSTSLYSHGVTVESRVHGQCPDTAQRRRFVGWGDVPFLSEYSKSGKLIFDASLPDPGHDATEPTFSRGSVCRSVRPMVRAPWKQRHDCLCELERRDPGNRVEGPGAQWQQFSIAGERARWDGRRAG